MDVSPTGYVILGMLRHQPRSGYEIKQMVDHSTRFFWAASYGQIYPELRKLAKGGLVEGEAQPQGGRKRTLYRLTPTGSEELRRWLSEEPEVLEIRDEGLLKLFFASAGPADTAMQTVEARQRIYERKLAALREIEPRAAASADDGDPFPYLVLRYGIESSEWAIGWCERARKELATTTKRTRRRAA
jgi:PadR family transcriptional regulator, regulatory protein AphA